MKKIYLLLTAVCLSVSAMAQEKFEQGKPNDDNYRYLDNYLGLKEYIDYSKYPNFKLGAGTDVGNYVKTNSTVQSKHAYAGFVRGLNGGEPTAINKVDSDKTIDTSKGIYNINGLRMRATSLAELPSGLYVVNGKEVVVR